jgi:hypothetical protein
MQEDLHMPAQRFHKLAGALFRETDHVDHNIRL